MFLGHILQEPLWLQAWVLWMVIVNAASIAFLRHYEGKVVLGVWIANFVFMSLLFEINGYNRLLGLSHVVWWTPLVVHLFRRWPRTERSRTFLRWLGALAATNAVSLVIDYVDVVRYVLGDRT